MKVLVLYVAALMQEFSLTFPAEQGSPGLDPPQAYVRKTKTFQVTANPR